MKLERGLFGCVSSTKPLYTLKELHRAFESGIWVLKVEGKVKIFTK